MPTSIRRRRRRHTETENHERWLVSYADFITLLFAFFVVMYAVSSVNEGKYRVLSAVLETAFGGRSAESLGPLQSGRLITQGPARYLDTSPLQPPQLVPDLRPLPVTEPKSQQPAEQIAATADILTTTLATAGNMTPGPGSEATPPGNSEPMPSQHLSSGSTSEPVAPLQQLLDDLQSVFADLVDARLATVRRRGAVVEVEIKDQVLFASGTAAIGEQALEPIGKIAALLKDLPTAVQVEGYTDNIPINTAVYPSNWELSAARAASVVHLLMNAGVPPERMSAIGYGEYRPIAENNTEQGRSRNRRVVLVISDESEQQTPRERLDTLSQNW